MPQRISTLVGAIAPSATLAIDAKARALRASGVKVTSFGAGEPDFPTPDYIVAAAVEAAAQPASHHYTAVSGLQPLRKAVAAKTARDSGLEVSPAQVLITNGGKQAIANTFLTLLDPGDEVIVPAPYWVTFPEAIALAGGVPMPIATTVADGFRVTLKQLEEVPDPVPAQGEVLIRTHALGINRAESMFRRGEYGTDPVFPSGVGYEAAGVVAAVGAGVTDVSVGQAVSVVPSFTMTDYPVHGELVLAPAHAVVVHPDQLSFEEAASVWMQFVTAYGGLIDLAQTRAGDTVLIPAASSSVGLAAIQVAHKAGAHAVALTRTSAKRQQLLDAGADAVIATAEEDVVSRVRELTDGTGARVIFDPVGGPALSDLIAAAAHEGIVVIYGLLDRNPAQLDVGAVLFKHLTIRGFELFEITTDDQRRAGAVEFVRDGIASGQLTPTIDRTFRFDDIAEAHRYLEAGGQVGKIVVTVEQHEDSTP